MSTLIIATVIGLAVLLGLRVFITKKGSCGDCHCSCPIKDQIDQSAKVK